MPGLRYKTALSLLSALFLVNLTLGTQSARATPPAILTQNNDNARTGANLQETQLTPTNVNAGQFGKLFTRTLDANVNGQVLYVPNLMIQGALHNVIICYTSNNVNKSPCSVFAFDADDPNASAALWRHILTNSAEWTTCTPAIDLATNTIYVLTKDTDDSGPTRLRALDLLTGNEKAGSPITVAASLPGTGDGNVNKVVSFDTTHANCRPGLLFLNGVVYFAFAHNSDSFPYHGWIFGYQYDASRSQFAQTAFFCTNPNGGEDGIWMAGKGLAADSNGFIYAVTGNGTFDVNTGGSSYGMCYLKLSTPNLQVVDWFAPHDQLFFSQMDLDLGNSGLVGIPGTNRLFGGASKFGSVFLLDSTAMGHFTSGGPDKAIQRLDSLTPNSDIGQNPICWDASSVKYIYLWPGNRNVFQFKYDPAVSKLNPAGIYKQTSGLAAGGSLTVTSNGTNNGILWAVGGDGVVRAYDATDVSKPEFWDSNINATRDNLGSAGHFQFPTVVNGKAYIPSGAATIVVYGLLPVKLSAKLVSIVNSGGHYVATVQITDNGPGTAVNLQVSGAQLNGIATTTTPLPSAGNLAVGGSANVVLSFPLSAGSSGQRATLQIQGNHSTGSFNSSLKIVLP